MIRNEWSLNWEPISVNWQTCSTNHNLCKHGGRSTVYCAHANYNKEDGEACKTCYIRQQSMDSYQAKREGAFIDRVCDRCKESITDPDTAVYLDLQNHFGGYLLTAELCRDCAREVASWVENEAFAMPPPPRDPEAEARIAYAFARIAEKEHEEYIRKKEHRRKKQNEYARKAMKKYRARKKKEKAEAEAKAEKERIKAERKEQTRQRRNAKRREKYARKKAERLALERAEAEKEKE